MPSVDELAAARLALEIEGPVATISLAAPDRRNAMVPSMWHRLADIGAALPPEIRIVVLRGQGPCFSAGLDLGLVSADGVPGEDSMLDLAARSDQEMSDIIDGYQRGFTWLGDPRFVSIAEVHGFAVGGGFQMALACDLRVVAEDAWFCMKEPALGLVPDLAGTKPLVDAVGYPRALEICATARRVGAHEAVQIGLATTLAPASELRQTTADLVAALLANPAEAVRGTTRLLQQAASNTLDEQRLAERTAQIPLLRGLFQ